MVGKTGQSILVSIGPIIPKQCITKYENNFKTEIILKYYITFIYICIYYYYYHQL